MSVSEAIPIVVKHRATDARNVMSLDLPQPLNLRDYEAALGSLICYYSWPNISAHYVNNKFSYVFNGTTREVTIPDGFYSISDLNGFLQFQMELNGEYLVDENGAKVFYLRIQENQVYYAFTLTATPIPSVLPDDWTNPNGIALSGNTPQLVVPSAASVDGKTSFGIVIGFEPGTYPSTPETSITQINSTKAPQISPVTSVSLSANFVSPSLYNSAPSSLFDFVPDVSYGSLVSRIPNPLIYFPASDGSYSRLILELLDQDNRALPIVDPNFYVKLLFRRRN